MAETFAAGPSLASLLNAMNGDGEIRGAEPAEAATNARSDGQVQGDSK